MRVDAKVQYDILNPNTCTLLWQWNRTWLERVIVKEYTPWTRKELSERHFDFEAFSTLMANPLRFNASEPKILEMSVFTADKKIFIESHLVKKSLLSLQYELHPLGDGKHRLLFPDLTLLKHLSDADIEYAFLETEEEFYSPDSPAEYLPIGQYGEPSYELFTMEENKRLELRISARARLKQFPEIPLQDVIFLEGKYCSPPKNKRRFMNIFGL